MPLRHSGINFSGTVLMIFTGLGTGAQCLAIGPALGCECRAQYGTVLLAAQQGWTAIQPLL
jgi:hypothetical protein